MGLMFLNAIGVSKYIFVALYFGLFFLLWLGNKEDKYEQERLLGDEEERKKDIKNFLNR